MAELKRTMGVWLIRLGLLALLLVPLWLAFGSAQIEQLPSDFRYRAEVFSVDNFYDEERLGFRGEQLSKTKFSYQATGPRSRQMTVRNVFDVRQLSGERIFAVARQYSVDRRTGRHVPSLGDKPRQGYLFAPSHLRRGQDFTYWHVNYDAPARMKYQGEATLNGLRTYRYAAKYQVDQTSDLGHLPGVPERRGVNLDVRLSTWIEPLTGYLVKYEDRSTAWYYDRRSHRRIVPWNKFHNQYTRTSIETQVRNAQQRRDRFLIAEWLVPILLAALALALMLAGWRLSGRVRPARRVWASRILAWSVLLGLLGLTGFAWLDAKQAVRDEGQARFETDTGKLDRRIEERFAGYEQALRGLAGLFEAGGGIGAAEWQSYVDQLSVTQAYPGIQAISFARQEPSGRAVVTQIEPDNRENRKVRGFDLAGEPVRRTALRAARDSGTATLTRRVRLEQARPSDRRGFLMIFPIYEPGAPRATVAQRRSNLRGYATVAFRTADFVRSIRGPDTPDVGMRIEESSRKSSGSVYADPSGRDRPVFVRSSVIDVANQDWTIHYASRPGFEATVDHSRPRLVLFGGLLMSLLIFGTLMSLARRRDAARALANRMVAGLRTSQQRTLAQKRLLDTLLQQIPVGVILADAPSGKIQVINPAARKILGLRRSRLVGMNHYRLVDFIKTNGDPYPDAELPLMIAARQGRVTEKSDLAVRKRDGSIRQIRGLAAPILDARGKVTGAVAVDEDITELTKLEKSKEEFVALASHQLRTPASGVKAALAVLASGRLGKLNKRQQRVAKEAYKANDRELRLIDDLLNVARLESGQISFNPKLTDLHALIKKQVSEISITLTHRNQKLVQKLSKRPALVNGDPDKLHMVIDNLLSNASKYTPNGGRITLAIRVARGRVQVSVTDTGKGIAKADQTKLFHKFSRIESKVESASGTGLGLFLAKKLTEMHGGKIRVRSAAGRGSTFTVDLPQAKKKP